MSTKENISEEAQVFENIDISVTKEDMEKIFTENADSEIKEKVVDNYYISEELIDELDASTKLEYANTVLSMESLDYAEYDFAIDIIHDISDEVLSGEIQDPQLVDRLIEVNQTHEFDNENKELNSIKSSLESEMTLEEKEPKSQEIEDNTLSMLEEAESILIAENLDNLEYSESTFSFDNLDTSDYDYAMDTLKDISDQVVSGEIQDTEVIDKLIEINETYGLDNNNEELNDIKETLENSNESFINLDNELEARASQEELNSQEEAMSS